MQLIYIPGLMCNHRIFNKIAPQIHIKHGFADTTKDLSIRAMAERLLNDFAGDLTILGYSMGGYVALQCAMLAPERVKKLILCFTHAGPDSPEKRKFRLNQLLLAPRINQIKVHRKFYHTLVHSDFHEDSDILDIINLMNDELGTEVYYRQLQAILEREDFFQHLPQINIPALVLEAEDDQLIPKEKIRATSRALPNAQHFIIRKCGHTGPLERPEQIIPLINQFVHNMRNNTSMGD